MKLACEGCEGSEGAAGGDSMGAESLQAAMCYVTVSQDFCSFGKESIASGRHFLGSCQPRSRCGVIGGGARGLGGVQTGGMAGLVTSRFRVWTDLIEPATIFHAKVCACGHSCSLRKLQTQRRWAHTWKLRSSIGRIMVCFLTSVASSSCLY
jgi:hypothetical protein